MLVKCRLQHAVWCSAVRRSDWAGWLALTTDQVQGHGPGEREGHQTAGVAPIHGDTLPLSGVAPVWFGPQLWLGCGGVQLVSALHLLSKSTGAGDVHII